ncbi:serine/threonine protein kinase [Sphaeroforma arctica JP610]|uniref:non-specific serine/threonine protein kinase n=1 Tax=Sphaeroforma arctica JP610 TaxID=667725 RepID=A0A0L0FS29_9EUKA|nr:serine/threonine protein kinase [Sphaeroforma arctica JP610]KNC79406.1 serine/threonine protein kinase [Sphaeroforma arctica JP610]|eukprot:XP_014153308.1 serine/threonine protein kinase [Sphaeroforma arctica JP610]
MHIINPSVQLKHLGIHQYRAYINIGCNSIAQPLAINCSQMTPSAGFRYLNDTKVSHSTQVKQLARQVLLGVDYLHTECKIIHTDIKPENILLSADPAWIQRIAQEALDKLSANQSENQKKKQRQKEAKKKLKAQELDHKPSTESRKDSGLEEGEIPDTQTTTHTHPSQDNIPDGVDRDTNGTATDTHAHNHPPESIGEEGVFVTKTSLPDSNTQTNTDTRASADSTNHLKTPPFSPATGKRLPNACAPMPPPTILFELATGDFLFHPKASKQYGRDEDHLALIIELSGPIPLRMARLGSRFKEFFTQDGKLRHIHKLNGWALRDILFEKYHFKRAAADEFAAFLEIMLDVNNSTRATARECLEHPWLRSETEMDLNNRDEKVNIRRQPSITAISVAVADIERSSFLSYSNLSLNMGSPTQTQQQATAQKQQQHQTQKQGPVQGDAKHNGSHKVGGGLNSAQAEVNEPNSSQKSDTKSDILDGLMKIVLE